MVAEAQPAEAQPQGATPPSKPAGYETLLWARVRELASLSLLLYGLSLIILGIGVATFYGDLTIKLIDVKADLTEIAGTILLLCGSILTCFVFGPLAGFMGLMTVKRPALQGWKTVATILGIMLFVSTLIGVIGLNLFEFVNLSILMIVFTALTMVIALLGATKNVVALGMLLIASGGLLVPLVAGYEHLMPRIESVGIYIIFYYPYIASQTAVYLSLGALVALVFIGIALIVKSLNISKPLHSLSSAIGVAAYTLGLVFVAADIANKANSIRSVLARARGFELSANLLACTSVIASTILAICGLLAFVSALLMIGSALKGIASKNTA